MNSLEYQESTAAQTERSGDELSVGEFSSVLKRKKAAIGKVVLITIAIASGVVFLIPVKYTAETVIFTPQQAQPSLSAMAQLAGGGGAPAGLSSLGLLSGLALRNPGDLYVAILESRTIADALIAKFDLKRIYRDKDFYATRKELALNTSIKTGKDTLIRIKVQDGDPKRAAALANSYVEELSRQTATATLGEATRRRTFFEEQLAREKDSLATAEIAMRDTQQFTGLVSPNGQGEALIRSVAQLHAEILSRQASVEGMRAYVTDENPRLQMVKRELGALKSELATLEKGEHIAGTPEVPIGQLPQAGLEYIRKYRDVKYHETLYEVLAKQYEAARLDEAKSAPQIEVIDRAVTPERKSWPPRTILVSVCAVLSAVLASFWFILKSHPVRRDF